MSGSDTDLAMANMDESLVESSSSSLRDDVDKRASAPLLQGDETPAAGDLPSQLVGQSHDILPLVFEHLMDLYTDGTNKWRKLFAPLLVVNKSFFQCAADMLWDTMDSLEPAFKLLPWFKTHYSGIGAYAYSGSTDWARFMMYASRIKGFDLADTSDLEISTAWFMELFTLPGRPHPLFPAVQGIWLPQNALAGPPIAFLLIGPCLECLYIDDEEGQPSPHALSILPTLPVSSPNIQDFMYNGRLSTEFLLQLGRVSSITTLELASSHDGDCLDLGKLRGLYRLESLTLLVSFFTSMTRPLYMKSPLPQHNQLERLKSLDVRATEHLQCLIARAISPGNLHKLTLTLVKAKDAMPLYLCLGLYMNANASLSRLIIKFSDGSNELPPVLPRSSSASWPTMREATARFSSALQRAEKVESFSMLNVPLNLAIPTWAKLVQALSSWSLLTCLCFRVDLEQVEGTSSPHVSTPSFPGLSLLASQVWVHCPKLEELEYHFDRELVSMEDLTESLMACENRLADTSTAAGNEHPVGRHRLRKLCVNTGKTTEESKRLELSVSRKIEIATFLDRLFPALEVVEGSASEVWSEIGDWVKAFQDQKTRFEAQVDGVLAGY